MFKYSLSKLKLLAERFSEKITSPHAVLLNGDLGTGKTTFAQYFLQPILIDRNVSISSPTFTIVNTYETVKGIVWHADLYRLKNEEELSEIGLVDFVQGGIVLIEWSALIEPYITNIPKTIINL